MVYLTVYLYVVSVHVYMVYLTVYLYVVSTCVYGVFVWVYHVCLCVYICRAYVCDILFIFIFYCTALYTVFYNIFQFFII